MRHLIDSNILIYLDLDPQKLTETARETIANSNNELLLSMASLWELQIKIAKGKLELSRPLPEVIRSQWQVNGIQLLGILPEHIYTLASLPPLHGDPFDRLIIAQSKAQGLPVITSDGGFADYGVTVIW